MIRVFHEIHGELPEGKADRVTIDIESVAAIDVHTHAEVSSKGHASLDDGPARGLLAYFKVEGKRKPTLQEIGRLLPRAEDGRRDLHGGREHRDRHAAASPTRRSPRRPPPTPTSLIPFASHRPLPRRGRGREARRLVEEYGVTGASSSTPASRASSPTTGGAYPLYEVIEESGAARALPHRPDRHRRRACPAAAASG